MDPGRTILFLILTILISIAAPDHLLAIAYVDYLEGEVELHNDGEIIPLYEGSIGYEINLYQLLNTKAFGYVELSVPPSENDSRIITHSAALTAGEETSFYFRRRNENHHSPLEIVLLTGNVELRIFNETGDKPVWISCGDLTVQLSTGTVSVQSWIEGSILVSCSSGRALCQYENQERSAEPGIVLEHTPDGQLISFQIRENSLPEYKRNWLLDRQEILKNNTGTAMVAILKDYISLEENYRKNRRILLETREILDTYRNEIENPDLRKTVFARDSVVQGVSTVKAFFPRFEKAFYQIILLEQYYRKGVGKGIRISRDTTSDSFFLRFRRSEEQVINEMSIIREIYRYFGQPYL